MGKAKVWGIVLLVFAACGGAWPQGARGQEKWLGRLRFEKGQKLFVRTAVEQNVIRQIGQQERTLVQNTWVGCDWDVEQIEEDGGAWIKQTYRSAGVKIKGPGVDVEFDSTKDKQVPIQALSLVLLLNQAFYVKISPVGKIERINGLDELMGYVKASMPDVPNKVQMAEGLRQQLSEQAIRMEIERKLAIYPSEAKEPGQSWGELEETSEGAEVVVEREFTLKELREDGAVIEVAIDIKPSEDIEPVEVDGQKVIRKISGLGHGRIEISEPNGWIVRSEIGQDMVEQTEIVSRGAVLRRRQPEPVKTHRLEIFEMSEREDEQDAEEVAD